MAKRRSGRDAGALGRFAHAELVDALLLDELHRGFDQRRTQVAMVVCAARGRFSAGG
ncbi:hypothetical protein D3C71_1857510 [compost metagenome]